MDKCLFGKDDNKKYLTEYYDSCNLLLEKPTYNNYIRINKKMGALSEKLNFKKIKIAILSSVTLNLIQPVLETECMIHKIKPELYFGGFNIFEQEIVDENSDLYRFDPDIVIIFLRIEEAGPKIAFNILDIDENELKQNIDEINLRIFNLISSLRKHSDAKLLISNFTPPTEMDLGIMDAQHPLGQTRAVNEINNSITDSANHFKGCHILNYNGIFLKYGKEELFDLKKWNVASSPFNSKGHLVFSREILKFIVPFCNLTKKCLVLDLDNTLWGGIIGEDGIDGIDLGDSAKGTGYIKFQSELAKLTKKGFLLAINSKNNYQDAMEVLETHPGMKLSLTDFASIKINWDDKSKNMIEISRDLNIGLDSFIFIDDSPQECELIKYCIPEVLTIRFPENPQEIIDIIMNLPELQKLSLTVEDSKRGEMYAAQSQRKELEEKASNLEDYYRSLGMVATISRDDLKSLSRIAQMTQKTNQFNLTTYRYSENDILNFISDDKIHVYSLQLKDKFGDNGIVGLIILRERDHIWEIDTFLLSCRVINRTVETAFLSFITAEARKRNIREIVGKYIPTAKNRLVCDIFEKHGFEKLNSLVDDGGDDWVINCQDKEINCPEWIDIIYLENIL